MNRVIVEDVDQILKNDLPWEELRNKSVVVVTGNDLMYAYFVHALMQLNKNNYNITVIAVARDIASTQRAYGEYIGDKNFYLLFADDGTVFDTKEITEITNDIFCIIFGNRFHTMNIFSGMTERYINTNILDVLKFLNLRPKNFLFHSSIAQYGNVPNDRLIREEDEFPFNHLQLPNGLYKETRRLSETMCCSIAKEYGIRAMIIRAPSFYGPETDFQSHHPLSDFLYNVLDNQDIVINSDGSPRRDFSYFSDVNAGCFYILFKGKTCEAYNLTSTQNMSLKEIAEIMVSLYPKRHLKVIIQNNPNADDGRTGNNKFLIDISKAKFLGWEPKIDIKNGIKKTIEYFESLKS